MMRILILGHARHGKDTVAEMLQEMYGFQFESSSMAAIRIFLFDALKDKYGYQTMEQCFEDRVNHRSEWYDLIESYNTPDRARMAKEILKISDIYVGMRSNMEFQACKEQKVFDFVIGVYNPFKALEPRDSFSIDMWSGADIVIPNGSSLEDLRRRVQKLGPVLTNRMNVNLI